MVEWGGDAGNKKHNKRNLTLEENESLVNLRDSRRIRARVWASGVGFMIHS